MKRRKRRADLRIFFFQPNMFFSPIKVKIRHFYNVLGTFLFLLKDRGNGHLIKDKPFFLNENVVLFPLLFDLNEISPPEFVYIRIILISCRRTCLITHG